MKLSYIAPALVVLLIFVTILGAQAAFPRMTSVEPATTKAGAEASVAGENLDKGNVTDVFLTDGQTDVKVQILEQAATAIKFRVPTSAKAGRFSLMVLTSTKPPRLIEQPVKLTVE
jgi:hypothetical protein